MPAGEPSRRAAGTLEGEVLAALWTLNTASTAGQVQAELPRSLAYTTVLTILNRLTVKGLVSRERRGPSYLYQPVVTESAVAAEHFSVLLSRGADRRAVLRGLVQAISPDEADVLRELLDQAGPPAQEQRPDAAAGAR